MGVGIIIAIGLVAYIMGILTVGIVASFSKRRRLDEQRHHDTNRRREAFVFLVHARGNILKACDAVTYSPGLMGWEKAPMVELLLNEGEIMRQELVPYLEAQAAQQPLERTTQE